MFYLDHQKMAKCCISASIYRIKVQFFANGKIFRHYSILHSLLLYNIVLNNFSWPDILYTCMLHSFHFMGMFFEKLIMNWIQLISELPPGRMESRYMVRDGNQNASSELIIFYRDQVYLRLHVNSETFTKIQQILRKIWNNSKIDYERTRLLWKGDSRASIASEAQLRKIHSLYL